MWMKAMIGKRNSKWQSAW